jgi:hypothetical protein
MTSCCFACLSQNWSLSQETFHITLDTSLLSISRTAPRMPSSFFPRSRVVSALISTSHPLSVTSTPPWHQLPLRDKFKHCGSCLCFELLTLYCRWNFITAHPHTWGHTLSNYINSSSKIKKLQMHTKVEWDWNNLKIALVNLIRR